MLKSFMFGASAIGLVSTAALAEQTLAEKSPAAQATAQTSGDAATPSAIAVTTRDDARTLAETQFLAADVNVDGGVDKSEFAAFSADAAKTAGNKPAGELAVSAPSVDEAFMSIAKGDAKITRQEMIDARMKSFDAADGNKDKALDGAEQAKFAALTMVKADASRTQ
ncbi:MAG: hypothetical protein HXY21_12045 [Parvularculaceae bacterium]|nr:hypothetical protein [Parvularculaceae bacterium]